MFSMRANQLKRTITSLSTSSNEERIQLLSEQLLENYFSEDYKFGQIYENLNQINLLGQIFARMASLLVNEDVSDSLIYKIFSMIKIGEVTIAKLAVDDMSIPIDYSHKILIAQSKLETLQDEIKTFRKQENHKITNFEGVFKHLVDKAPSLYNQLKKIKEFTALLGLAFGVEDTENDSVKQIEHINIKELLFISESSGDLIQTIFKRYDGLLTYTMSLLTMISGTGSESEFKTRLNSILESLGTSTQIILLQQRLLKTNDRNGLNKEHLAQLKNKLTQKSLETTPKIQDSALDEYFAFISQPYIMQSSGILRLDPKSESIIKFMDQPGFILLKAQIDEKLDEKYEIAREFHETLQNITEYFESIIRKTNTITADLFSKGFRAAIPLNDVETCEKAGIHIRNITATSSTQKIIISDLYFDLKLKLFRLYEKNWDELKKIISPKAHEEQSMQGLPEKDRIFSRIFKGLEQMTVQWSTEAVMNGRSEEVVISSRILFAVVQLLQKMWNSVIPFKKINLSNETLPDFKKISDMLEEYWTQFQKLFALSLIINNIGKRIWYLNREFVITVGEKDEYFKHPEKIKDLISDIPQILKQEFRQKLITKEIRRQKKDIYDELLTYIDELSIIPAEDRNLLMEFEAILDFMAVYEE